MQSKRVQYGDSIDINAMLDGQLPDEGVTYAVREVYQDFVSLTAEGILTPLMPPPDGVAGVIVSIIEEATGTELAKVVVVIKAGPDRTVIIDIEDPSEAPDLSPPLAPFLEAHWQPTSGANPPPGGEIVVTWDPPSDPESGITSSVLSIISEDETDQLLVDENVLNAPLDQNDQMTFTVPRLMNGKRYVVTLLVTNGAGIETTRTVFVEVPEDSTPPEFGNLSAVWDEDTESIVVDWGAIQDVESAFILELTVVSQDATDELALTDNVTGLETKSYARTRNGKVYDVTLKATNSTGLESALTVTVTVPGLNDPTINAWAMWEPNQIVIDWAVLVDPYTTLDSVKLTLTNLTESITLATDMDVTAFNKATFPQLQSATQNLNFFATITAKDGWGNEVQSGIGFTVPQIGANLPPVVEGLRAHWENNQIVVEWDDMYDVETSVQSATIYIEDFSGDDVLANQDPVTTSGAGTYSVARTPNNKYHYVKLTVTDTQGAAREYVVSLDVPPQAPPDVSITASWASDAVHVDWEVLAGYAPLSTVELSVISQDGTDVLRATGFVGATGNISLPRTKNGKTYVVTVTAKDQDELVTTRTVNVKVPPANTAPEILSLVGRWDGSGAGQIIVEWAVADEENNITSMLLSLISDDETITLAEDEEFISYNSYSFGTSYAFAPPAQDKLFNATLTVTDAEGLSDTLTVPVSVPGPTSNIPPYIPGVGAVWNADVATISFAGVTDPDGTLTALTLSVVSQDGDDTLASNLDVLNDLLNDDAEVAFPRTMNGKTYLVTLTATDDDGAVSQAVTTFDVPSDPAADTAGPSITMDLEWASDSLNLAWNVRDRSGVQSAVLRLQSEDGTDVLANGLSLMALNGMLSFPRTRNGKTYIATIVAADTLGNEATASASCEVPAPLVNQPINVRWTNNGDNTATVTWNNLDNVGPREFLIGLRDVASDLLGTNPPAGRVYQLDPAIYQGLGPCSITFPVPESVPDGPYDVYVQDTVTSKVGFAVDDETGGQPEWERFVPVTSVFTGLAGVWNPNQIEADWGVLVDPMGDVAFLKLIVESQDKADIFAPVEVLADPDRSYDTPRTKNGKRYNVTLKAYKANNSLHDVTTVVVTVPDDSNRPMNVMAEDGALSNSVLVSWNATEDVQDRGYYIGVRKVGTAASHSNSVGRILEFGPIVRSGMGRFEHLLNMGRIPTGTYEFYVQDAVTARIGYARLKYEADDITDPVVTMDGSWANDFLTVVFSASDPESPISSLKLTVKSTDNTDTLADEMDVLSSSSPLNLPRTKNGKTYNLTLTAINEAGFVTVVTDTVVVPVFYNTTLSASDSEISKITFTWNDLDVTTGIQIGPNPEDIGYPNYAVIVGWTGSEPPFSDDPNDYPYSVQLHDYSQAFQSETYVENSPPGNPGEVWHFALRAGWNGITGPNQATDDGGYNANAFTASDDQYDQITFTWNDLDVTGATSLRIIVDNVAPFPGASAIAYINNIPVAASGQYVWDIQTMPVYVSNSPNTSLGYTIQTVGGPMAGINQGWDYGQFKHREAVPAGLLDPAPYNETAIYENGAPVYAVEEGDGGDIYFVESGGSGYRVVKLNGGVETQIHTAAIPGSLYNISLEYDPADNKLYINSDGQIMVHDGASLTVLAANSLLRRGLDLSQLHLGKIYGLGATDGKLYAFDTSSLATTLVEGSQFGVASNYDVEPMGFKFGPATGRKFAIAARSDANGYAMRNPATGGLTYTRFWIDPDAGAATDYILRDMAIDETDWVVLAVKAGVVIVKNDGTSTLYTIGGSEQVNSVDIMADGSVLVGTNVGVRKLVAQTAWLPESNLPGADVPYYNQPDFAYVTEGGTNPLEYVIASDGKYIYGDNSGNVWKRTAPSTFVRIAGAISGTDRTTSDALSFDLSSCKGVAYDELRDTVYYAENNAIYRIRDGIIKKIFPSFPNELTLGLGGIFFERQRNSLYFSAVAYGAYQQTTNGIFELDLETNEATRRANYYNGYGTLTFAAKPNGDVVIGDGSLRIYTALNTFTQYNLPSSGHATGVALAPNGDIVVGDNDNKKLWYFRASDSSFTHIAGTGLNTAGNNEAGDAKSIHLGGALLGGVKSDDNGNVYVGQSPISKIYKNPRTPLVDAKTANSDSNATISATSTAAGYEPYYAFDLATNTWRFANSTVGFPQSLVVQFPAQKTVSSYMLKAPGSGFTLCPKDWVLEGSNDGSGWTALDSRANETGWTASQKRYYSVASPQAFSYYRIRVTANNGSTVTAITEAQLYETTP